MGKLLANSDCSWSNHFILCTVVLRKNSTIVTKTEKFHLLVFSSSRGRQGGVAVCQCVLDEGFALSDVEVGSA